MSSSTVSTPAVFSSSKRFTGRVKWFNNKAGYGFITVTDGPKSGSDVFVHHSSIKVDSEQYKYLVQGEYVDFSLSDTKTSEHEFQAGEVCGIKGGKLMCETRRETRVARSQYHASKPEQTELATHSIATPKKLQTQRQRQRQTRARGEGPREEEGEWTYVSKIKKSLETSSSQNNYQHQTSTSRRGRPPKASRSEDKSQSS